MFEITCTAPINIAVIKYWGKRDEKLILPTNSSISVTLTNLYSKTTIRTNETSDFLYLDGKQHELTPRFLDVLRYARQIRSQMEVNDEKLPKISILGLTIASVNNFPTAAGLASSASGFACLTFALAQLYHLKIPTTELSKAARLGSGSACRSMFGGFVKWEMGVLEDGSDSRAVQIVDETFWELEALVLVVSDSRKDVGSTKGMQETCETSTLFKERIKIVAGRITQMENAIKKKDFDLFAELTMMDSNSFHAVCLDTFPPIFYLNDISKAIIKLITLYNNIFIKKGSTTKGYRAAYTFDAGPNAVIYMEKKNVGQVLALLNHFFPSSFDKADYLKSSFSLVENLDKDLVSKIGLKPWGIDSFSKIIHAKIASGPSVLSTSFDPQISLLTPEGFPINHNKNE